MAGERVMFQENLRRWLWFFQMKYKEDSRPQRRQRRSNHCERIHQCWLGLTTSKLGQGNGPVYLSSNHADFTFFTILEFLIMFPRGTALPGFICVANMSDSVGNYHYRRAFALLLFHVRLYVKNIKVSVQCTDMWLRTDKNILKSFRVLQCSVTEMPFVFWFCNVDTVLYVYHIHSLGKEIRLVQDKYGYVNKNIYKFRWYFFLFSKVWWSKRY